MPASAISVAAALASAAILGAVGADSRWVVALGDEIADRGAVPDGVPYASAPTEGWPKVLVAAELVFHWLYAFGERGLFAAHLVAVAVAFALLAARARLGGATDAATAVVLLSAVVGTVAALAVVRLQLFSLALFPVLLLLLDQETRERSRRIWLLVPLVALWGNLHGAVLIGFAVASAYLLLERARSKTVESICLLVASALALLATPALLDTVDYYRGVMTNEAARRGFGLWAPLDLTSPIDWLFLGAAAVLAVLVVRARPRLWEIAALVGLAILTVKTARSGVWLLFMATAPAARALAISRSPRPLLASATVVAFSFLLALGVVRGPRATAASPGVVQAAVERAGGTAVLAEPTLAEQVALAGGTVWVANPLDAFRHPDQRLYLDWLEAKPDGDAALAHAPRVVMVTPGSDPERRLLRTTGVEVVARDSNAVVYTRSRTNP